MSELTPNLGLFKYDLSTDGKEVFSINTALNNNWDILDERCGSQRNIGEIVTSTIPLTDAGLHLLDGALIDGSGGYADFVDYIADLYNNIPVENVYNVNIVGSLTNDNGVLSGFAGGVYATIKEVPYSTADSIEILLKTTTGTLDTSNYKCFYSPVISDKRGVNIHINPSNQIVLYVSSNDGSSWDIANAVAGTTILQSNTQYYFKYVYTGTNHILYMSTTGAFAGEETTEVNVTNSGKPSNSAVSLGLQAWSPNQNNYYWRGSIDLNESYININGERWWSGKTEIRAGFLTEDEWQQSVTDYGVCGKFVYTKGTPTYYAFYVTVGPERAEYYVTSKTPQVGDKVYKLINGEITEYTTLTSGNTGLNVYQGAIRDGYYGTSWYRAGDIEGSPNTVRLPKITGIIYGTTDITALGDLVEAGLPNITGGISNFWCGGPRSNSDCYSGAFAPAGSATNYGGGSSSGKAFDFDASRSNPIYGNSTTVQPQSIKVLYYIVIATSTKTIIQVDIDEIATDLNGKADVDLTNVNDTGYIKMAGASMPSDKCEDLTPGASGTTYTAPANGWFVGRMKSTSSAQILGLVCTNSGNIQSIKYSSGNNQNLAVFLPSKKNDIVELWYGTTPQVFRFIYAQGSESEAN